MITIHFGLELTDRFYPNHHTTQLLANERSFLTYMETQLCLVQKKTQEEFLRGEQYRQLLQAYLETNPQVFFADSFAANGLATANMLLQMRDELKLSNWNFGKELDCPSRLQVFSSLETLLKHGDNIELNAGFADRFIAVEQALSTKDIDLKKIILTEPFDLLPGHWQRLFAKLQSQGLRIENYQRQPKPSKDIAQNTDLENLQLFIQKKLPSQTLPALRADGSVLILRTRHESEACNWMAKLAKQNPEWQPVFLIPAQRKALDIALIQEGLPSMGLATASQARPTLQLLKLVTDFLWKPMNPYKLLEFLNLPNKPLNESLSRKIAEVVAQSPGLFSDRWRAVVAEWFEKIEQKAVDNPEQSSRWLKERDKAQEQYKFWFDRVRQDLNADVAARTVIILFDYVKNWAIEELSYCQEQLKKIEEKLSKRKTAIGQQQAEWEQQRNNELQTQAHFQKLIEQSSRLAQILETLPPQNNRLSQLELERLVKYIDEPTNASYRQAEKGCFDYVQQPSALGQADEIWYWDFVKTEQPSLFSRWYPQEIRYLKRKKSQLDPADLSQQRRLWQQKQPILAAQNGLGLLIPEYIEGEAQEPHRLYADIQSLWPDVEKITYTGENYRPANNPAENFNPKVLNLAQIRGWSLPDYQPQAATHWEDIDDMIDMGEDIMVSLRDIESFSSLNELIYKPHEWLFKYILGLRRSPILNIVSEDSLRGNLAHNIVSDFIQQWKQESAENGSNLHFRDQQSVKDWIATHEDKYMEREGAILSMYGKEPEKLDFFKKLNRSLWELVNNIQVNGWSILGTEQNLAGQIGSQKIEGRADLVLERGQQDLALLDLKWKNSKNWLDTLKNREDLQLAVYAGLLAQNYSEHEKIHTAYFSLLDGKTVARDQQAFKNANQPQDTANNQAVLAEVREKFFFTVEKQLEMLKKGKIITNVGGKYQIEANTDEQKQLLEVYKATETGNKFNRFGGYFDTLLNPLKKD